MEEHDLFQVATKALVYNPEGKFLLLREKEGYWDLPGGRIHYGESFAESLKRECKEELGVECRVLRTKPDYVWSGQNQLQAWRIDLCFEVELASDKFVTNDENLERGYFNLEEARELNLSPHLNNLIEIHD